MSVAPGMVRDSIINYLSTIGRDAGLSDISRAVATTVGKVSPSSIRSYLNLNVPDLFERTERGRYRLKSVEPLNAPAAIGEPIKQVHRAKLYQADCFDWLAACHPESIHAVVTDPPYGLLEYSRQEQEKLRRGKGGFGEFLLHSMDIKGRLCRGSLYWMRKTTPTCTSSFASLAAFSCGQ